LWRDVLDGLLQNEAPTRFRRPPGLAQVTLCADSEAVAGPACPAHRLEWVTTAATEASPARAMTRPLRISYPDPGTVIVLDPRLPSSAQQVPIEIDADAIIGSITIMVDGVAVGERQRSAPVGWAPTAGHHVLRAISSQGIDSSPVEIEVVPS
jgi:hypothetical protein